MHKRVGESKESYNQRSRTEYQKRKEYFILKAQEYRDRYPNKTSLYNKKSRVNRKLKVLNAYGGPKCNCCGETTLEFLTIDHINNNGSSHRKEIGGSSMLYLWLIKNNFPVGFQVLCYNCNLGKRVTGICPHKVVY